ncbi:MAG: SpoIIE family protein phosphatase [Chloroflexota bacterium]
MLTRALGPTPEAEPDTFTLELKKGDTLLLCSDGLHGQVGEDDIAGTLRSASPEDAARRLVDMANAYGGNDYVTVALTGLSDLKKGKARSHRASETIYSDGGRGPMLTLALLPFLPVRLAWRIIRWFI